MELQHWVRTPEPGRKMAVRDEGKYWGEKLSKVWARNYIFYLKLEVKLRCARKRRAKCNTGRGRR